MIVFNAVFRIMFKQVNQDGDDARKRLQVWVLVLIGQRFGKQRVRI